MYFNMIPNFIAQLFTSVHLCANLIGNKVPTTRGEFRTSANICDQTFNKDSGAQLKPANCFCK